MKRNGSSDYDKGNRVAASIILAAPEKYQGAMRAWALSWMAAHGGQHQQPVAASVGISERGGQLRFAFETDGRAEAR